MRSVFEPGALNVHTEMYQAWVLGEPMPTEDGQPERKASPPQPRLSNWDPEDLEAYCGIYTDVRRAVVTVEAAYANN